MNSEVFRGKEFSNRIKLSQLVQDLLQLWGMGQMGHRECLQMCAHMCTDVHTHGVLQSTC